MPRTPFTVNSLDVPGGWLTNYSRYGEYAKMQLAELQALTAEVRNKWPLPHAETLRDGQGSAELRALARKRDLASDAVKIFSAMAIEGFINFYGVVRLGEATFKEHFERRGLVPKLRALLLLTDSLDIAGSDPMIQALRRVAHRRNNLVHPNTSAVGAYVPGEDRGGDKIPDVAEASVRDMETFFQEFGRAVPDSRMHIPAHLTG